MKLGLKEKKKKRRLQSIVLTRDTPRRPDTQTHCSVIVSDVPINRTIGPILWGGEEAFHGTKQTIIWLGSQ